MGANQSVLSQNVWNKVGSLGEGATFTGPEFREKYFPKVEYRKFYGRVHYLSTIGVLKKINTWNGDNNIIYEVADLSKLPRINLSKMMSSTKKSTTAPQLFPGVSQKMKTPPVRATGLVESVNIVADILTDLLKTAKEHPQADIKNFTTAELFTELERRTKPAD